MNRITQKSLQLFFIVAVLCTIISLFLIQGITSATEVKCKDYFTKCTDGGCDAKEGWKAENCKVRCGPEGSDVIVCEVPMI